MQLSLAEPEAGRENAVSVASDQLALEPLDPFGLLCRQPGALPAHERNCVRHVLIRGEVQPRQSLQVIALDPLRPYEKQLADAILARSVTLGSTHTEILPGPIGIFGQAQSFLITGARKNCACALPRIAAVRIISSPCFSSLGSRLPSTYIRPSS